MIDFITISNSEQAELQACEAIIERNLAVFYETGQALLKIRDARLYRATHSTFEDYCRERWGFSRVHAHRMIDAATVAENLLPMGNIPASERQARELAGLEAERQREVWQQAVETAPNGKVTAAHIALVRDGATAEGDDEEWGEDEWDDSPEAEFVRDTREAYAANRTGFNVALPDPVSYGLEPDTKIEWDAPKPHVANNSGNNEWYTPPDYIAAAREVMGSIDLDPASSVIANKTVQAKQFFTADDDGLQQEWRGNIWMNPPYAAELIGKFASKLCLHFFDGDVSEAIVLVNNATETRWFQEMAEAASAICFPKSRVRFLDPAGNPSGAPLQGQAVIYMGPNVDSFKDAFSSFGFVLCR